MFAADSVSESPSHASKYRPVFVDDPDDCTPHFQSIQAKERHKCWSYLQITVSSFGYVILTSNILYLIFLLAMIHPTAFEYARNLLSGHTTQPTLETYAQNCDLTWDNILSRVDVWMAIHFVITFFYTLSVRHRLFMWINSIMWEVVEFMYFRVPMFHMTEYKECWFDSVIFDVLIANALGIEAGLLVLKVVSAIYPKHDEWCKAVNMICKCRSCAFKWVFIIFNLLFFQSIIQLTAFAFIEYTFWLSSFHWFAVARFCVLLLGSMGVFSQLYQWLYQWVGCCTRDSIGKLYWIIIIWSILCLECGLTVRHYLQS